ncbi:Regulator of polyketide synthase expression [Actinokineospora spheciospongiae]|uniref:Regulator of polyketide synthase expression n=1 Tax=Actinokineospora spheciospongiae TaxID=909613 RepID=W7IP39_9PSEU|nr:GAF domain-containing protein [Actinokineospora spheciospongiae]EWC58517.1 Regulator of polyketide synthase expression [Actinokineospora spheciospongiae]
MEARDAVTDLLTLLDLLAEGASPEELSGVAATARASGLGGDALAAVDRAVAAALRVRRTVTAHRRREAELTALFDTAGDLAALRDTDAVLRSIVHRARMLLGVDVSYLSLNDEHAGKTYVRVTDGSVSALFQQVQLGMGEGLGGLVAQTARPYASRDYFADTRFNHTGPIDSSVRDEGLTAILGVPLALGSRVIGVLYAADRTARDFTPDEVALLSSLADHAAIAIDTARLLDSTRAALAELNTAHTTISGHVSALRQAAEAHDKLMDLVLRGGDLDEVAGALASVLGGGIAVFDAGGAELARVGDPCGPFPVEASGRAVLVEAPGRAAPMDATGRVAAQASGRVAAVERAWVCAVQAGPEVLGSLVLSGRADLGDAERRLFERAGVVTALLLLLRRSVAAAEDEVRGELLSDLLTAPTRNPSGLAARGARLGVDLSAPHMVLVCASEVPRRRLATAASRYGGLVGVHAEQVVVLAPGPVHPARVATDLGTAVDAPVTVGAAGPATGIPELAAAHAEAARCARSLLALDRAGDGATTADLGFIGLLLGDTRDLTAHVDSVLGPVLDYDSRRGTDLLGTLTAYFDSGASLARAKDLLHVHVNTVVQRLDRVATLLGEDWQDPRRALEIQLALRLHRLRR